jgi:hypothetical protein
VKADLEEKVFAAPLSIEAAHGLPHLQSRSDGPIRRRKGGHHGVPDGLHHRSSLTGHDLVQDLKMRSHEVVSREIADALVKLG